MRDANKNMSKDEELVIPYDDIAEVVSSCNDIRFKPKYIFKNSQPGNHSGSPTIHNKTIPNDHALIHGLSHSGSNSQIVSPKNGSNPFPHRRSPFNARKEKERTSGCWISTGLVPHFIVITFYEKWMIRKVSFVEINATFFFTDAN